MSKSFLPVVGVVTNRLCYLNTYAYSSALAESPIDRIAVEMGIGTNWSQLSPEVRQLHKSKWKPWFVANKNDRYEDDPKSFEFIFNTASLLDKTFKQAGDVVLVPRIPGLIDDSTPKTDAVEAWKTIPWEFPRLQPSGYLRAFIRTALQEMQDGMFVEEGGSSNLETAIILYLEALQQGKEAKAVLATDVNTSGLFLGQIVTHALNINMKVWPYCAPISQTPIATGDPSPKLLLYKNVIGVLEPIHLDTLLLRISHSLRTDDRVVMTVPLPKGGMFETLVTAKEEGGLMPLPKSNLNCFQFRTRYMSFRVPRNFFDFAQFEAIAGHHQLKIRSWSEGFVEGSDSLSEGVNAIAVLERFQ